MADQYPAGVNLERINVILNSLINFIQKSFKMSPQVVITVSAEEEKRKSCIFIIILKPHFILLLFYKVYGFSGSLLLSILLPSWRTPPPAVHRSGLANHLVPSSAPVQMRPWFLRLFQLQSHCTEHCTPFNAAIMICYKVQFAWQDQTCKFYIRDMTVDRVREVKQKIILGWKSFSKSNSTLE